MSTKKNQTRGKTWVTEPSDTLEIRKDNEGLADPVTIIEAFETAFTQSKSKTALRAKRAGMWKSWSYEQYLTDVKRFARALLSLGVEQFEGVSILGFNAPEWTISNIGAIFAGAVPAGIYITNNPEACHYVAEHSGARIIVVDSDEQMQKIVEIKDRLPLLKAVVTWGLSKPSVDGIDVYKWDEFLDLANKVSEEELTTRQAKIQPNNLASLLYTSGTTGNPKAVMLSHDNILSASYQAIAGLFGTVDVKLARKLGDGERVVSYLPLSHIAGQQADVYMPGLLGLEVSFAQPDALKGSLVETLCEVQPTRFIAVPRVWEKFEERMRAVGAANGGLKRKIGTWAKGVGLKGSKAKLENQSVPWGWGLANALAFSKIKAKLGLDCAKGVYTAAAPISMNTLEYFMSLDLTIREAYGMSECAGCSTFNTPEHTRIGTIGQRTRGMELRIADEDDEGNGELCFRSRSVFMGYMKNPEASAATIDDEGWLHSGDLAKVEDGFYKITGRIKELIITAGGENIAPILIEDAIKKELQCVSNAVVIGDKKKYLSCLLTLKSQPDKDAQPTIQFAPVTRDFVKDLGSSAPTIREAAEDAKVQEAIQKGIDRANAKAISRAHYIRKWIILADDFSIPGGELTPTMKLKRRVVNDKYAREIVELYPDMETPQ